MITPGGIQVDGTLDADGSPNMTFGAQWSSAAARTPNGWTITEMAVPFKHLPFRWSERVIMGFKVARFISGTSEELDFPEILPETTPHLSQFQTIQSS